jgi:hypothetical protein
LLCAKFIAVLSNPSQQKDNLKDPSVTESSYSQSARMEKQVRQALQMWADHVWEITGQSVGASNVVVMPKRA